MTVGIGNGLTARGQTFNGSIPGPTMELEVGETVIVHYENRLAGESGIHWHGIELPNASDGTPFTQNQVQPGGDFLYKFTVPRPGIYWYHPHHHYSTNQVFKGLYGMIVVKDPTEAALQADGTLPPPSLTKPIVLSDITVCKAPGANDGVTYDSSLPHVSGAPLPTQQPPTPENLCEGPSLPGPPENPYPADENGNLRGPFAAGEVPNIQTTAHMGHTNEGQTVLTNGVNVGGREGGPCTPGGGCPPVAPPGALAPGASVLSVKPGQGIRLQLVNAATTRYFRLQLTAPDGTLVPLVRVGGQGGLLDEAIVEGGTMGSWNSKYQPGEIVLPPGGRADVVAAIPISPTTGTMTLWTSDYARSALGFENVPTVPVMHLGLTGPAVFPTYSIADGTPLRTATGNPVESLGPPDSDLLKPADFSPPKPGLPDEEIKLTVKVQQELGIDDVFGTHDVPGDYQDAPHLGSSRYAEPGDTLELEVTNLAGGHHPYHPHGFSIQPISMTNEDESETYVWPQPEFVDVVDVPGGFTLKYRVRLDERALVDGVTPGGSLGRWIFHCHIFFHAMDGMLSELVVTGPGGNERPNVNVDESEPQVEAGTVAKVTGTYDDPDGDRVTLSSSVGSVAEEGNGRYTWSYPTGSGEASRIVYITATDANGLKGQIPLFLTVKGSPASAPPSIAGLRVRPKRFVPVGARPQKPRKHAQAAKRKPRRRGTWVKFALSEPARVEFTVTRLVPKRPRLKARTFSRTLSRAGRHSIRFSGRFRRLGALPRGRYRLSAKAVDPGGLASPLVSTRFRVIR